MRVEQRNALFTNMYVRLNPLPQSGCWSCWNLLASCAHPLNVSLRWVRCSGCASAVHQATRATLRSAAHGLRQRCKEGVDRSVWAAVTAQLQGYYGSHAVTGPYSTPHCPPVCYSFSVPLDCGAEVLRGAFCSNFQPNSFSQTASFWRHRDTPTALLFMASSCCR